MYTGIFAAEANEWAEKRFALTDRARSNKKQSCTEVCNQADDDDVDNNNPYTGCVAGNDDFRKVES